MCPPRAISDKLGAECTRNQTLVRLHSSNAILCLYKEFGLEVNAEKTKCMLLSHHQNAGQNHNINIGDRSFENVAQLKYLVMRVTNQNLIQEEIQRRLLATVQFSSEQFVFSSASKNVKIKIYKTNFACGSVWV
jgi:hypothetical protein